MEIDNLHINQLDHDLFVELSPKQKLEFLWVMKLPYELKK